MKEQFWKKTVAGLMALLIVSGGMPLQPVSKIFERTAITAKATNIAPTPITGLVAEKNEYGYWKFQALVNAGEYDEASDFNYWYSVKLLEIYDDTMSDEAKGFEIFEYNADYSYYTTSVPKGNYPGKYEVYYGISDTDYVENPSSFEVIITKEGTVSTIVSTTVENGIYTGFTATSGTTGASTSEGYAKLVDGNKSTKWCIVDPNNTCYVEFNSDIPFIPTGYTLTTGNDNSQYTGRNPAGWKLYGKLNENDDWTVLAEVTQDTVLEDKDNQSYDFDIENNTSAYQYFRFEFSQTKGSNVFQLSELQFKGEAVEEATDLTEPSSENASEPTEPSSENASEPTQSLVSVTYLDENGTEQTVDAIPLESGSESYTYLEAGWYVVNSNITYKEVLELNGDVKLILADNCTMTMTDNAQIYGSSHNLTIYGQKNGTGKLESDISSTCINIVKDYAQYGGIVDLKSKNNWAFNATGDNSGTLTLAGGTLNATSYDIMGSAIAVIVSQDINITGGTLNAVCTSAESSSNTAGHGILISSGNINISGGTVTVNVQEVDNGYGIYASEGAVNITGGTVNVTGGTVKDTPYNSSYGIYAYRSSVNITGGQVEASSIRAGNENITLAVNKKTDYIKSGNYTGTIQVESDYALTDGTKLYYGILTNEQASALAGKKLIKADSVQVSYVDVDKRTITLPLYSMGSASYIPVSASYLDGYTYKCLKVNGTECADMAAVIAKIKTIRNANPTAEITIEAVYEQNSETFKVTVIDGTLDDGVSGENYQVGTELTVTANAPEEGYQFSYWMNNGAIASYNEEYAFHVPAKDVTLKAVYSPAGETVEKSGTAFIESVTPIGGNKLAFVSKVSVPKGARILKAGIVANIEENLHNPYYDTELTANTAQFTRYESSKCYNYLTYKFTWTKSNVSESDVWCVRSYLVYRDENGKEYTVYGELVKANLNGMITE